jgi:hypothetical protein
MLIFCCIAQTTNANTKYYLKTGGTITTVGDWYTGTDGTGTQLTSFGLTNIDFYVFQNTSSITLGATWSPSGTGSVVYLGADGSTPACTLNTGAYLITATALTVNTNAYFKATTNPTITTLVVNGTYDHNNTGTVKTGTWNTGSTIRITGVTSGSSLSGMSQSFYNVEWNCSSQSNTCQLSMNTAVSWGGNFTMTSTGTGKTRFFAPASGDARTLTIGGNFYDNGGTIEATGTGTTASVDLIVNGLFNLAGGTYYLQASSATGYIHAKGNVTISSGTINKGSGTGTFYFSGTSTQTFSKTSGTISSAVGFIINSNAIVDFGTSVLDGSSATFTLSSGGTLKTGNTGGIASSGTTGSIQVGSTRSFSTTANYEYNGSSAQVTGTGLQTSVNNLTINNSAGVTLSGNVAVSGTMTMTSGALTLSSYALTYGSSGILAYNGSSMQTTTSNEFPASSGPYSLTINNSSNVSLHAARSLSGILTMTSGKLKLGNYDLTCAGSISGAGSSKYIATDGTGQLKMTVGSSAVTFPIGPSVSLYNPLILTNTGTSDTYGVVVASGSPANMPDATKAVNDTWTVTEGTAGGSTLAATTQWASTDEASGIAATRSTLKVGRWTGSAWESNTATVSGSNPYTAAASGFTGVGAFTTGYYDTGMPTVDSTTIATNITTTTAQSGGYLGTIGSSNVTASGVCFGTSASPAIGGTHTTDNTVFTAAGSLVAANLTSLTENTKYYYRAYATNTTGTSYGPEYNFTTISKPPTSPSGGSITYNGFTASWTAPASQGAATYTYTVEVDDDPAFGSLFNSYSGIASGTTTQAISGLSPSTDYYFRVKAVNTTGSSDWATSSAVHTSAPAATITVGSITAFSNQVTNSTSSEKSYTVSGAYLTNDITITPPSGFEISTGTGGSFAATNPITLYQSGGTVASTTIYVRFKPQAVTSYSGNITHVSTDATIQNVAVSGTGIAPSPATAFSISHKSDNIIRLTWTAPASAYDNVVVFAHATSDITHTPTGAGSAYNNANSDIASAGTYDGSFLVYSGTGASVEVTGLTAGTVYYFNAYAYCGSGWSSAATSVSATTAVQPTTAIGATAADGQSVVSWTNPTYNGTQTNYWTEVLVLAKSGSAVDQTPSGEGSSYTANTTFGSGTDLGSGSFVVYKGTGTTVTVTSLTNGTAYYYRTFVRHGSNWSTYQEVNQTPSAYALNDFGTASDGTWATTSLWRKWDGSGWNTSPGTLPTSADNVWILNNVTLSSSPYKCKNLHVANGASLKAGVTTTTIRYLHVFGSTIETLGTGSIGTTATGDNADGLSIYDSCSSGTFKITGSSSSTIAIDRLQIGASNQTIEIDHDVTLNYHGSAAKGNATPINYVGSGNDNNIIQVNAGKTLTFAKWACITGASSSSTDTSVYNNITYNVYGTLTMSAGVPDADTNTTVPTWGNSYISCAARAGKTFTLHVFNGGAVNANKFYANGANTLGTYPMLGTSSLIVDAGGVLNLQSDTLDFKNSAVITGNGTVNVNSDVFFIGSASGITASSAAGPIQTSTRNYASPLYEYAGSVAQVTGDGLPSTITSLKIRNSAGIGLSQSVNVGGTLTFTSGTFTVGANTLTLNNILAGTTANLSAGSTSSISIAGSASGINIPSGITALNNLTLNNTNGTTLQAGLTLNGVLTLTSGLLTLGSNNLALNGAIAVSAGTITSSSGSLVSVGGSGAAILPAGDFYNLTLNRSSGAILNGPASIAGTLTLTSGTLDQNSNTLTINSGASVLYSGGSVTPALSVPATLTNYTPAAGTTINSTTVNGTVTLANGSLTVASGETLTLGASGTIGSEAAGQYVVGKVQAAPVTINAATASNIAGLGVSIAAGTNNLGSTTVIRTTGTQGYVGQGDGSINRRWKITPTTQPTSAVNVTLTWVSDDDNGKNVASLAVWKSENDGSTWYKVAGGLNGTGTPRSVTFSTSSFSDFTILGENELLPVELSALSANVSGRNVLLNWTTATEVNSYKFVVERTKSGANNWAALGEVQASKYSNAPKYYSFADKNLNSGKYTYRLKMVDNDGSYDLSTIETEANIAVPTEFSLMQNYPNPFNPSTKISYAVPANSQVSLDLYSLTGQKVATLVNGNAEAGYYDIPVNMSQYGLASGVYIYRFNGKELNSGKQFTNVKKMMFLK